MWMMSLAGRVWPVNTSGFVEGNRFSSQKLMKIRRDWLAFISLTCNVTRGWRKIWYIEVLPFRHIYVAHVWDQLKDNECQTFMCTSSDLTIDHLKQIFVCNKFKVQHKTLIQLSISRVGSGKRNWFTQLELCITQLR